MMAFRGLDATHRCWLLALVACALLARALVPSGWMPLADAQGVRIIPCPGAAPVAKPIHHTIAGMDHDRSPEHHGSGADSPCAFAGLAAAIDLPALAAPLRAVMLRHAPPLGRSLVAVGHGLAAPPPPPTGPPPT